MARTSVDKKYIRSTIENVQTNQITISEDKLRIKLEKQIGLIKKGTGIISYLGLTITSIGVLVTADMKDVFGITPDMWQTVFFIIAVFSFGHFLFSLFHAIFHRTTVDTIVKDIKTADREESCITIWERIMSLVSRNKKDEEIEEEAK